MLNYILESTEYEITNLNVFILFIFGFTVDSLWWRAAPE